jgi:hypothetical protein
MRRAFVALAFGWGLVAGSIVVAQQSPAPPPQRVEPGPMAPITTGATPTFTKDVAPILYKNCTGCHRPGTVAPMSLLTYKDARPWAKSIRDKIVDGEMPPWHADPKIGRFANARLLTDAERQTLVTWANTGSREGNPADLPAAPTYTEGWSIGEPDLVVRMEKPFEVPADGIVEYQWFSAPTNLTEDKWIKAMEIRAGDASVVHHALAYAWSPDMPPRPRLIRIDEAFATPSSRSAPERSPGGVLMVVASGTGPYTFPSGSGRLLRKGSIITFQMHYTTNGKAAKDQTEIGFVFAKEPPQSEMRVAFFSNAQFVIPPGAADHRIDAEATFLEDVKLWSIFPHTHLRGKRYEYKLMYPDGRSEMVLSVPRYDFEWQTEYHFAEPLSVPKGTKIVGSAWYDNSVNNRFNPDPKAEVRWGDQTWEEMMFNAVSFTAAGPAKPAQSAARSGGQ